MGVEYFTAESPQHERAIRATINSYTRRSEVETLRAQLDTNAREKAAVEAREAAQKQWVNRPEYQERITKYHEIKDAIGQAEADLFWQGANAELVQIEQQELTTRMGKLDESARQQAAQAWVDEAYAQTATLPALVRNLPQFGQWFQEAVDTFDARMERGHFDAQLRAISDATTRQAEMHRLFFADLGAALTRKPEVIAYYRSLGERETQAKQVAATQAAAEAQRVADIEVAAVEKYKQEQAAKRGQVPPHPLGNLAAAASDRMPHTGTETAAIAVAKSPAELKRMARAGVREDVQRRFGP